MAHAILVLGLGNPLRGDDGIGPRLVEALSRRGLPEGVVALDGGTGGLDLLSLLEQQEWRKVVVVDAADVGLEPGRCARFTPGEARIESAAGASLHRAGLGEVLALARALGRSLPEIVILGVQPAAIGWGEGLSPAVDEALPALVGAVLDEVTGGRDGQDSGD